MAYKISEDCTKCGACKENCPADAINFTDGDYIIDPEKCIDCGTCSSVCPVDAPKPEE